MSLSIQQQQELATQIGFELDVFSTINSESPTLVKKLDLVQYWYEDESAQPEQELPATVKIQRNVTLEATGDSRLIKLQLDGLFFELLTPDPVPVILRLRDSLPKGYTSNHIGLQTTAAASWGGLS